MDFEDGKKKAGGFIKEFKEFAMKGSVIDLAVGVVIGGAFGAIVSSLVSDIIMPFVSLLVGKEDFSSIVFKIGDTNFPVGNLINAIFQFLIISFSLFIVIRQLNKLTPKKEEAPATTKKCKYCLSEVPLEATRCPFCTSELE